MISPDGTNFLGVGKSQSTLANYMHCVAHVAFHFNRLPTQLDLEQIEDYLLHLKKKGASQADFKLTVYGLRFLFRCEGLDDRAIRFEQIGRNLNGKENKTVEYRRYPAKAPALAPWQSFLSSKFTAGLASPSFHQSP